jgi:tetratricopeptide (TPR) repeat protein
LAHARITLDERGSSVNDLTVVLTNSIDRAGKYPKLAGELHFLLGSAYERLAAQMPADRALEIWRRARTHLEQALELGVAEADLAPLMYRLAKAWFHTDGDPQQVVEYLRRTVDLVDERFEAYGLLAQAYLRLPKPDVRAALNATQRQVHLPIEDERILAPARLMQGELQLRLGEASEREAARRILSRIGTGAPPDIVRRARIVLARSYIEDQAWDQALPLLEEVHAQRLPVSPETGLVYFWLGLCYRNLNQPVAAVAAWQNAAQAGGEAGQAATMYRAEALVTARSFAQALDEFRKCLAGVSKPDDYRNSLLSIAQVNRLLDSACQKYQEAGMFENALEIARIQTKLSVPGRAQVLHGQLAEAWAQKLWENAQSAASASQRQQGEEAARTRFDEAGAAFAAAVNAAADPSAKANWLWRSAACYRHAQDHDRVVAVLGPFIALRPPLDQLSEAWFRLGEAHQALHHGALADTSYRRCIETSGPFEYRARYQLAVSEIERGNLANAEDQLTMILEQLRSDTDREAHENTLYLLAEVLYRRANYRSAALRWEQALMLYPTSPNALLGRFGLADSYQRLADFENQNRREGTLDETNHYRKHYTIWLEKAAANYQKLFDDLEAKRMKGSPSDAETVLLRNSLFRLAACRFDLGQYDESARLYDALVSRYQQSCDGFLALKQLYVCQVMTVPLDKPQRDRARATLQRARALLDALDDSAFQNRPPSESRQESEKWLKERQGSLDSLEDTSSYARPK